MSRVGAGRVLAGVVLAATLAGILTGAAGCTGSADRAAHQPAGPSGSGPSAAGSSGGPAAAGRTASPSLRPSGPSSAASGSPSPDPVAVLRAAGAAIAGRNLRFALGNGVVRADGSYDAAVDAAELLRVQDGREVRVDVFPGHLYLAGFTPSGSVLDVTVDRLPAGDDLLPVSVPLLALRLLGGVTRADQNPTGYEGRIDLATVDPGPAPAAARLLAFLAKQAGDRAGDIPFTANVDAFGRLAGFRAIFPRGDAGRDLVYELAVTEVDVPLHVSRPVGTTVDAPDSLYQP